MIMNERGAMTVKMCMEPGCKRNEKGTQIRVPLSEQREALPEISRGLKHSAGERTRPRVLLAAPRRNLAPSAFSTLSDKRTPNPSARRRREHAPASLERLRRREGARARVLPNEFEISGLPPLANFWQAVGSPSRTNQR